MKPIVIVHNKEHLKAVIKQEINQYGNQCDLNHIDLSQLTDISELFFESDFNGDISQWDVSHIKNMGCLFMNSKFNGDISKWNISQVTNTTGMFCGSDFNQDLSQWNTSQVKSMAFMFFIAARLSGFFLFSTQGSQSNISVVSGCNVFP